MSQDNSDMQSQNSVGMDDAKARQIAGLVPFKKGQSGNPAGRPKSALISDAMRRKLSDVDPTDEHKRTYAEVIASKMVEAAATGDRQAAQLVVERMEGKARQTIHLSADRRDQLENLVSHYIQTETEQGRPIDREAAIRTLSIFESDVSELLN